MAPFIGQPVTIIDGSGVALVTNNGTLSTNIAQIAGFGANLVAVPGTVGAAVNSLIVASGQLVATSATTMDTLRTPTTFKQAAASLSGSTALWTPAAGKKFRLMRYMVSITSDAHAVAQADLVIALLDAAGGTGQTHIVNIPVAAVVTAAPPLYVSPWMDLGNGFLSALANNVLNINLSFALTSGQCNVIACGTEE